MSDMCNIGDVLEEYRLIKQELAEIKEKEMDMRIAVCEMLNIDQMTIGTHSMVYPDEGLSVKLTKKESYSIKIDESDFINLSDEEMNCISTKYGLSLSAYKSLGDTDALDEYITVKNAAPTVVVSLED